MALDVCLVIHPYTARKDLGFGHDRYAAELLSHLPNHGVRVSTFDSGFVPSMAAAAVAEAKAIVRLAALRGPQLYHATATLNAMAPLTSGKHPLVTSILDVLWFFVRDQYDSKVKFFLKSLAIRRAAKRSDAIIVPFTSQKDFLVNELRTPAKRIHIVPFGIDQVQFRVPDAGETVPRPAFMPASGRVVLFVGALTFGKGIDTLIKAMPEVVRKVPDVTLVVGSKGWHESEIKALWESSPVRDRIQFVGFIPEDQLRAAYIHADVSCFPSRYGFGLSIMESMACGTPTVSGRTLDAPEYVGDAGLMADPNSSEELAAELIRVLDDRSLHAELRRKGLEKCAQATWDRCAAKTVDVYRTVA